MMLAYLEVVEDNRELKATAAGPERETFWRQTAGSQPHALKASQDLAERVLLNT